MLRREACYLHCVSECLDMLLGSYWKLGRDEEGVFLLSCVSEFVRTCWYIL